MIVLTLIIKITIKLFNNLKTFQIIFINYLNIPINYVNVALDI